MAHEQAQQYQREMHERTQNNISVVNQGDVSAINKLFNRGADYNMNTHASNASFASGIDYTSSRFHNTLLGRNDTTLVVSEAIRAQNEKNALEKAKEHELKSNMKRAHQENKNMLNAQKTKERGLQAMEKIMTQRDVKDFESQMKKV